MSRVLKKWSKRSAKRRLRGFRAGARGRWLSSSTFLRQPSTAFFGRTNYSLIGCGPLPSPDPQFGEKLLEVVALYMKPPDNAVVLCVDEKTGIQALDRTQPMLPLRAANPTFSTRRQNALFFGRDRPPRRLNKGTGSASACSAEQTLDEHLRSPAG